MIEANPHRRVARTIAFICYVLAFLISCVSVFFILAAATADMREVAIPNITNARMTIMISSMFGIIVIMVVLLGWRIQRVFGQHHRQEKPVARSAVGCLRLGSLGCALWSLPTTLGIIFSGKILSTGEPAGIQDIFIGSSGFALMITLMISVAWFISANFVRLNHHERRNVYHAYLNLIQSRLPGMADPQTRAYVQGQTVDVLAKLDSTLKSTLLDELSKSNLLKGNTRISLSNLDFRRIDLRLSSLPEADLREINLEGAILEGAMLSKVNLFRARLKRGNLSHARLQEANLEQADLTEAVLTEAKLRGANLAGAMLKKAHLSNANLQGANLQGANLHQADLIGAVLKETDLRGADLTRAIVTTEQLQEAKL